MFNKVRDGTRYDLIAKNVVGRRISTEFRSLPGVVDPIVAQVNANQKNVTVTDASEFEVGLGVRIADGLGNTEPCNIESINLVTDVITMDIDIKGTYLLVNNPTLSTRDSAGIQEAINSLPPRGGTVEVPAGYYVVDDCYAYVSRGGVYLRGHGIGYFEDGGPSHLSKILLAPGAAPEAMVWFDGRRYRSDLGAYQPFFGGVDGLYMDGNRTNGATGEGVRVSSWSDLMFERNFLRNMESHGVRFYYPSVGMRIWNTWIERNWIEECLGGGIYANIVVGDAVTQCDNVVIADNLFWNNAPLQLSCTIPTATKASMFSSSKIIHNNCSDQSITLDGATGVLVKDNTISGSIAIAPHGVKVTDAGGARKSRKVQVYDNIIYSTFSSPAIWLTGLVEYSTIRGNDVMWCTNGKIDDSACTGKGNFIEHNRTEVY